MGTPGHHLMVGRCPIPVNLASPRVTSHLLRVPPQACEGLDLFSSWMLDAGRWPGLPTWPAGIHACSWRPAVPQVLRSTHLNLWALCFPVWS
jgi:hypothetical protein